MATDTRQERSGGLERRIGPLQATAINMIQMCGIGPFVTIPLVVAAMGGPQAMFGWLIGAAIALVDGLVWAELGAAMPDAGGTYVYLREAFQYRTGRLMPFLFAWTALLFIPMIMASGIIGLVQYLGYLVPGVLGDDGNPNLVGHLIGVVLVALAVVLLYRRIGDVSRISTVFFAVMALSVVVVIVAAFSHFNAGQAFAFTSGAFGAGGAFWTGLGSGLVFAVYDYLGYNTSAYLGAEVREPGKTLPRSIVYAILGIMTVYFLLQVGVLGALPWQEVSKSSSIASLVLETTWGRTAASVVTVLIIITAFASVFAGLLGGSRVPYEAAQDKLFFAAFRRLHPRLHFPQVSLVVMGVITAIGTMFTLTDVVNLGLAVLVIVQSVAQVVALTVLRRRQPSLNRPYKQWLYPVPSILALVSWVAVYYFSGRQPFGSLPSWLSVGVLAVAWVVVGSIAFLVWARVERTWPFGPKEIRERFLTTSTSGA